MLRSHDLPHRQHLAPKTAPNSQLSVSNRGELLDAIEEEGLGRNGQGHLIERGRQIANELGEIPNKNRAIIATLVRQVEVRPDSIKIHLSRDRLTTVLTSDLREWTIENALPIDTSDRILTLTAPAQLTRVGREMKLLVDDTKDNRAPDIGLLRILARAHDIHVRLIQDTSRTVHDIAREEASALVTFISFCVFVGFAPDITTAIVNGRQPPQLNAQKLMRLTAQLPPDWAEQRALLGFR